MNRFEKLLISAFFIELAIGGGGRLLEFGPLSIRQLLFVLLLVTFFYRIIRTKNIFNSEVNTFFSKDTTTIAMYLLLVWIVVSTAIGVLNHHPVSVIAMDMFRVSFLGLYFPLAYYISNERYKKEWIIEIIKWGALFGALLTIGIDITGKFILTNNFGDFYVWINNLFQDDLFFRPSRGVFYKSHLFIMFGLIISFHQILNKKWSFINVANVLLCTISIIWSETRGLLIAFLGATFFIACIDSYIFVRPIKGLYSKLKKSFSRPNVQKIIACMAVLIIVPIFYTQMTQARFPADDATQLNHNLSTKRKKEISKENDVSVATRVYLLDESKKILTASPKNLIFGTGYGTKIGNRLTGIEMSFLDIWVEQGIIGVILWISVCMLIFLNFNKAYKINLYIDNDNIGIMACAIALLLLTNINPFINNPIGIGFVLFALVVSRNELNLVKK
ncbi:O-antigen ligase family protein [Carnobacterium maltaromaticum]|uniref:O-antigen ligase family protein n=1 Tax=Carnobacterium maltaromaticum TaxID=2751 RepID=A0AAW9K2W7_CARML|nr:O-antigen ligase family protein [Carnobacterium maltaromaticum]MDW5523704.1 O-antigen ligase family protein [Carnobacterium maltaromaticum]MDZ5758800.1 O-antigen ligase family protein [Carnobacterium maltaromaticum]